MTARQLAFGCLLLAFFCPLRAAPQAPSAKPKSSASKKTLPPSPAEELQTAINAAGNDRAALVRNLEDYLKTYPESPQRPQIYRALVEACLQLRDVPRATGYAERIVALTPEDMSITLLTIQLLERTGDEPALRRAVSYSSRVLSYVKSSSAAEKSPRVSEEEWETEKKRDQVTLLVLRGRLQTKLHDTAAARTDYEASYALVPNAAAALKLGDLDELAKDYTAAATHYAQAFALSDARGENTGRREIRQKLGNVWRLAHGSDAGLGDFLLGVYDRVSGAQQPKDRRNAGVTNPYDFVLRGAPGGSPYPLAAQKGKVIVINFWATWCGPCRALEPLYERVAAQFRAVPGVLFLAADCDEDESLVPPYLDEAKPKTTVVFADGLDSLFDIDSFPTVLVLDPSGTVSFRSSGFGGDHFEQDLSAAVHSALRTSTASPGPSAQ